MKKGQALTKKASNQQLVESYERTGNIWKTAEEFHMCGQSVYERLKKLNVVKPMNYWTQEDDNTLREKYLKYKFENRLDDLARELGRTKQFICRKARVLGLTDQTNKIITDNVRLKISESSKKWIKEKGHPRGMLGHSHSEDTKNRLSVSSSLMWKDMNSFVNSEENRQRLSDNLHRRKMNGEIFTYSNRGYHKTIIGNREIIFKSSWEVEIGKRLQMLVDMGYIRDWGYETKHFNFPDMKRGVRSYCPDFEVILLDGSSLYVEVKGWKMPASLKRIEMFRDRYPDVKFYMIDENEYRKILSESDYLRRCCVEVQPIQDNQYQRPCVTEKVGCRESV